MNEKSGLIAVVAALGCGGQASVEHETTGDDGSPVDACYTAWETPTAKVSVDTRPSPEEFPTLAIHLWCQSKESGGDYDPVIELVHLVGTQTELPPSAGPFSPGVDPGDWVELQTAAGEALYTWRGVGTILNESQDGLCPNVASDLGVPNDPLGTHLVVFADPVDGKPIGPAVEMARLPLP